MRIAIIGTGYVGLVTGACFADVGNDVICVDTNPGKIDALKRGEIPIYEPGLETLVKRGSSDGRLRFTTSHAEAVTASDIIFMAVNTPPLPNGEPDLTYLKSAAETVGQALNGYKLIVNKSTVPIGSHQVVAEWMSAHTKHPFDVASNPEFLKEGSAVQDFLYPDRVVIGTRSAKVFEKMSELYAPFVRQGNPIIQMDPVSAEITKYACNAFLATRISFMNELSHLCERAGADIELVRKGMTTDVRIGKHFLYAGVGYGGSCFPKDIKALVTTGKRYGVDLEIVEAVEKANAKQKRRLVEKVKEHFGGDLKGRVFALWGLAFKPNTDDMREAPSLVIADELLRLGARVQAFDPVATQTAREILGDKVSYEKNRYDALRGADALLLVTEWNEFRHPELERMKSLLKSPVVFDGRNIFNPDQLKEAGFSYYGIGRS